MSMSAYATCPILIQTGLGFLTMLLTKAVSVSVFLLEMAIFQGFEGIFGGALIEAYAGFWPAVSIVSNEIEIKVTHNIDDVSFEMEDLTLEFHKTLQRR